MQSKVYSDVATFNEDFSAFSAQHSEYFAVFKGTENADGTNWCGDCVVAEPILQSKVYPQAAEKNIPVFVCTAGTRD